MYRCIVAGRVWGVAWWVIKCTWSGCSCATDSVEVNPVVGVYNLLGCWYGLGVGW